MQLISMITKHEEEKVVFPSEYIVRYINEKRYDSYIYNISKNINMDVEEAKIKNCINLNIKNYNSEFGIFLLLYYQFIKLDKTYISNRKSIQSKINSFLFCFNNDSIKNDYILIYNTYSTCKQVKDIIKNLIHSILLETKNKYKIITDIKLAIYKVRLIHYRRTTQDTHLSNLLSQLKEIILNINEKIIVYCDDFDHLKSISPKIYSILINSDCLNLIIKSDKILSKNLNLNKREILIDTYHCQNDYCNNINIITIANMLALFNGLEINTFKELSYKKNINVDLLDELLMYRMFSQEEKQIKLLENLNVFYRNKLLDNEINEHLENLIELIFIYCKKDTEEDKEKTIKLYYKLIECFILNIDKHDYYLSKFIIPVTKKLEQKKLIKEILNPLNILLDILCKEKFFINKENLYFTGVHIKSLIENRNLKDASMYSKKYIELGKIEFGSRNKTINDLRYNLAYIFYDLNENDASIENLNLIISDFKGIKDEDFKDFLYDVDVLYLKNLMAKNRHDEIFEYIRKSDNKYLKEYTESESIDDLLDKLDEIDDKDNTELVKIIAISEKDNYKIFNIFKQLYEIRKEKAGVNDRYTLKYKKNYAIELIKRSKDNFDEPRMMLQEIVDKYKEQKYPSDNDILATKFLLGMILCSERNVNSNFEISNNLNRSLEIFKELYTDNIRNKGFKNENTIRNLYYLIKIYSRKKEYKLAQEKIDEMIPLIQDFKYTRRLLWVNSMFLISFTLSSQNKFIEAKKILLEVYNYYIETGFALWKERFKTLEKLNSVLSKTEEYELLINEYEFFNLNIEEKFHSYRLKVKKNLSWLYDITQNKYKRSIILNEMYLLIDEIETKNIKHTFDLYKEKALLIEAFDKINAHKNVISSIHKFFIINKNDEIYKNIEYLSRLATSYSINRDTEKALYYHDIVVNLINSNPTDESNKKYLNKMKKAKDRLIISKW